MDGNLTNLAPPEGPSNSPAAEPRVRTHVIDRISNWGALGGTLLAVGLLAAGGSTIAGIAAQGRLVWFIALLVATAIAGAALVFRFLISPMVGRELRGLAEVAEHIAAGDLTHRPKAADAGGQLGRLGRGMVEMSRTLQELATLIRGNAEITGQRAAEITASTEHMAQAASGIAGTASNLSADAVTMADTIQLLSTDATRLSSLAAGLSHGASDGIARNQRLKGLATESAEILDESARRLDELAVGVQEGARATEALATASDEIRTFVALVQKIARQSKLLALNAAMEAARAGEHGEGFTVVANEVRRLAQTTSEAAEKVDLLMKELIAQMEMASATSSRSRAAVEAVRSATARGRQAFTQVERAVIEGDSWISAMANSASSGNALAGEINEKLDSLAQGTQGFASSMQDVAAASEEQSASTEEIAAAANALVQAAEKVSGAASRFRTS